MNKTTYYLLHIKNFIRMVWLRIEIFVVNIIITILCKILGIDEDDFIA